MNNWPATSIKFCALFLLLFLASCQSIPILSGDADEKQDKREKDDEQDSGPDRPLDVTHIPEPVPRVEPRNRAGNSSPYKVLGKTYHVLKKPDGYRQEGVASWYGRKFHGRRTANGEVYDMYGMTAAHTTLPIPSYVRVTNQANKRSIIVRVNDRGPFHGGRIIDLSYTAARKLGYENKGTAKVIVEYIDPTKYQVAATGSMAATTTPDSTQSADPKAPAPKNSAGYQLAEETWLQVGAFSSISSAQKTQLKLKAMTSYPVSVLSPQQQDTNKLYRVHVGPLKDNFDLLQLREKIIQAGLPEPHTVLK